MQEVAGSSPAATTIESSAILFPDLSYQNVWLQDLTPGSPTIPRLDLWQLSKVKMHPPHNPRNAIYSGERDGLCGGEHVSGGLGYT